MTTYERVQTDALSEFWNAWSSGSTEPLLTDLDPEFIAAVRGLHNRDETHAPDAAFVKRLEKQLMTSQAFTFSVSGPQIPSLAASLGTTSESVNRRGSPPLRSRSWGWRGALAVMMILAIVGALATTGRMFPLRDQEIAGLILPAREQVQVPALTFVREVSGGAVPLVQPSGFAFDEEGRLYVVDVAKDNVRAFDAVGDPSATWGEPGKGPGKFWLSVSGWGDVAVAPDGSVVVMDPANSVIQQFSSEGTYLRTWGGLGSDPGQFLDPNGIAIDRAGLVYVTDYSNHRVQVFDEEGSFLAEWDGTKGGGAALAGPADIAIGADGIVWVTDDILHRVIGFKPDGTVAVSFGAIGEDAGELRAPWGIAIDSRGNLYVAEYGSDRIQVFAPDGTSLATFTDPGTDTGQFTKPTYLAFGPDGSLFVADEGNHRLQEFHVAIS